MMTSAHEYKTSLGSTTKTHFPHPEKKNRKILMVKYSNSFYNDRFKWLNNIYSSVEYYTEVSKTEDN